jgi:hypothetical protein
MTVAGRLTWTADQWRRRLSQGRTGTPSHTASAKPDTSGSAFVRDLGEIHRRVMDEASALKTAGLLTRRAQELLLHRASLHDLAAEVVTGTAAQRSEAVLAGLNELAETLATLEDHQREHARLCRRMRDDAVKLLAAAASWNRGRKTAVDEFRELVLACAADFGGGTDPESWLIAADDQQLLEIDSATGHALQMARLAAVIRTPETSPVARLARIQCGLSLALGQGRGHTELSGHSRLSRAAAGWANQPGRQADIVVTLGEAARVLREGPPLPRRPASRLFLWLSGLTSGWMASTVSNSRAPLDLTSRLGSVINQQWPAWRAWGLTARRVRESSNGLIPGLGVDRTLPEPLRRIDRPAMTGEHELGQPVSRRSRGLGTRASRDRADE